MNLEIEQMIKIARAAFPMWMTTSFEDRLRYLEKYKQKLELNKNTLSLLLAQENGKPIWEAKTEIAAMIAKIDVSKAAYLERCKTLIQDQQGVTSITRHKPHGVVLVLGPFNFPGHLPNGHIVPALLAGNTVIFKPSELTPKFAQMVNNCWLEAGLPAGVMNLVQGGPNIGKILVKHKGIDGIFFTGSYNAGKSIQEENLDSPHKILALEMGGNNPLVVDEIDNVDAAVYHTIQSAFITSGQRCTCARRLIIVENQNNKMYLQRLVEVTKQIKVGFYNANPEPFMGPVISKQAAGKILSMYQQLVDQGAKILIPMQILQANTALLNPAIIDVTGMNNRIDEEIFGPLLQLIWVKDMAAAIQEANNTNYGLSAGLLSNNPQNYQQFLTHVRAGIINWNRPITGASSAAPFGGIGKSGNFRPSAYYAADYCSYPVASLEEAKLQLPSSLSPGIEL